VEFEWDPKKNKSNRAKHGISFHDAERIFEGPCLENEDDRLDYEETRFIAYGEVSGTLLAVAYAWRGDKRRIISARKATSYEARAWHEVMYGKTEGNKESF
jgi:uncharacterized DUF497 family protein